jgi:hypothetical protein
MDYKITKAEADESVKRVVEFTDKILKQKPSEKLISALKKIKEKEEAE